MARMRSPNYPAIPLKQAIGFAEKIFRADRTNVIDKEVAAEHMGYSGLTGRTLKLLAALSQYNLLDKAAKGKVRVSKTAVSILHGTDDKERKEALLNAARGPLLFRRIAETFDQPSEKTITSFLMKEGFTDTAVAPVLRSYSETNLFLAANRVSESYRTSPKDGEESTSETDVEEDDEMDADEIEREVEKPKRRKEATYEDGPLDFNFSTAGLRLTGMTSSPAELKAFIAKLTALAVLLPEDEDDEN
jgi:hypothetical protein